MPANSKYKQGEAPLSIIHVKDATQPAEHISFTTPIHVDGEKLITGVTVRGTSRTAMGKLTILRTRRKTVRCLADKCKYVLTRGEKLS